jgi:hypothetical protein
MLFAKIIKITLELRRDNRDNNFGDGNLFYHYSAPPLSHLSYSQSDVYYTTMKLFRQSRLKVTFPSQDFYIVHCIIEFLLLLFLFFLSPFLASFILANTYLFHFLFLAFISHYFYLQHCQRHLLNIRDFFP